MANLGTAYVQIVPSAQGISGSITQTIQPGAKAAGVTAGKQIATNIGSTLKSVGGGMMKAGGIATALSVPLVAGIKDSMKAYGLQREAETKLTEIYKTRMGVSDEAAKKTMDLASALQKQGVVGDEVTLAGAQQLATFAKMPGTVDSLLPAMNNLLVQQKGLNGTQQDATQIANLMGKVMMGQTGALKRVGISFDENQEKVLKYGTEQEKAAMLAEVITDNVGEMNSAFAETDEGKIQQMSNSLGDMKEKIGGAVAPALADLASMVSENLVPKLEKLTTMMQDNPAFGKVVLAITGILAVGGPLLVILGAIVSSVGALLPIIGAISAPVVGIAAGIAALGAILVLAWQRSESFRSALQNMGASIIGAVMPIVQMLQEKFQEFMPVVMQLAEQIGNGLGAAINFLTPIITVLIGAFGVLAEGAFTLVIAGAKKLAKLFSSLGRALGPPFKTATGIVTVACKKISSVLSFKGLVAKVASVYKSVRTKISDAVKKAKDKVTGIVKSIKKVLSFENLAATVSKTFKDIRDKMKEPIEEAKNTISGIVKAIKDFFPVSVGKIFSGWIPKIKLKANKKGDSASTSSSVTKGETFAKAMAAPYMFSRRTVFAAGEAGDEILYGRKSLMDDIREATADQGGDMVINLNYNASDDARDMLRDVIREVKRYKMAGAF